MLVSLFNANGLSGKHDRVSRFQQDNNIDLMLITETHFTPNTSTGNAIFSATKTSSAILGGRQAKGGLAGYLLHKHDPAEIAHRVMDRDSNYTILEWRGVVLGLGYFPPDSRDMDARMFELIEQTLAIAAGGPCVILGDFNARMGAISGDHAVNRRGRALSAFLDQSADLSIQIPEKGTYTSFGGSTGTGCGVTDIVLCGGGLEVSDFVVHEDNTLGGSDHRPLVFKVPTGNIPPNDGRRFERYNVRKFIEGDNVRIYQDALDAQVDEVVALVEGVGASIDECWEKVKGWIDLAMRGSCGMFRFSRAPRFNADFFTLELEDLQDQVVEKEKLVGILRRDLRTPRPVLYQACRELKELNTALSSLMASRRRDLFHKQVDNLAHPQQAASFLRKVKGSKAAKAKTGCQLDPTKMEEHEAHFEKTFGAELPDLPFEVDPPVYQGFNFRPVEPELVQTIIANVALGKAPGVDGIPGECYAYGGESMVRVLTAFLTRILSCSEIPDEWTVAMIVPIFKNKGDITKMENYRPIALTCVARRICEQVLIRELSREITCLQDTQGGFRKRRSTLDQAFCLHEIMISNPDTHLVLLDFKAAYDTVDRRLLWHKLRTEFHVPEALIYMLSALFDQNSSTILVKGVESNRIPNKQGLLQGSSLSPLLFNFFIDSLASTLNNAALPHLRTGGVSLNSLLFADDVVLFFKEMGEGRDLLRTSEEWANRNNMRFAPAKCIHVAPKADVPDEYDEGWQPLSLYDTPIQNRDSAQYLGIHFNENGIDFTKTIEERCAKALVVTRMLGDVGMNGNGWVYSSSVLAYKMFGRSIMEYGIALKPLGPKELDMLQKTQNTVCRKILGVPHNTSIGAMHKVLLLEPFKHRNLVLNAQFTARLFNNNDKSIPAVRIFRNKAIRGQQPARSKLNAEGQSLVNLGIHHNALWSKAAHADHRTLHLRHPRIPYGLTPAEAEAIIPPTDFVMKAFTGTQKKVMARIALIDFTDNEKTGQNVSSSIELNLVEGYRAICLPNPAISRSDRIVLMRWILGLVCQHQRCANCGVCSLSRTHGLECAGVREWVDDLLLEDFPEVFEVRERESVHATWLDRVLNALRHNTEAWVNAGLSQAIQVCLISCRKLVQQPNGYWTPRLDAGGELEEQAAQWNRQPRAGVRQNHVIYTQVQNPAQTAQRAAEARLRNRRSGRPTKNNRNRRCDTPYRPIQPRHLSTTDSSDEEEPIPRAKANNGRADGQAGGVSGTSTSSSSQHLPFSSTEVFNGGSSEGVASPVDLFEDEEVMYNWATQGLVGGPSQRRSTRSPRGEVSSGTLGARGIG